MDSAYSGGRTAGIPGPIAGCFLKDTKQMTPADAGMICYLGNGNP